jgi:hypothetical protein
MGESAHFKALDAGVTPATDVVAIGFNVDNPSLIRGDDQAALRLTDTTKGLLCFHPVAIPMSRMRADIRKMQKNSCNNIIMIAIAIQ